MSISFRNAWPHFLIWGVAAVYLITVPHIHDRFYIQIGKPSQENIKLPSRINKFKSNVDSLEPFDVQSGIYQLSGWAFLTADKNFPTGEYERQVVLFTPNRNYVFPADTIPRKDVQDFFNGLGTDVTMSGFSALINSHALEPGIYNIGIIFRRKSSYMVYYVGTNHCISRTPNRLALVGTDNFACNSLVYQDAGQPIQLNARIPTNIVDAHSSVEVLEVISVQSGIYQLSGWAFLTADKNFPTGEYERQVVLFTPNRNYVFPADTIPRKDVQDFFNGLGTDVTMSGFSALINSHALEPGIYNIGIIIKHVISGAMYYVTNNRCLIRTVNGLTLETVNSPICQLP